MAQLGIKPTFPESQSNALITRSSFLSGERVLEKMQLLRLQRSYTRDEFTPVDFVFKNRVLKEANQGDSKGSIASNLSNKIGRLLSCV